MDYQLRKIWNVIATIPGTEEPDRWVMIGNHRDAWVYGAVDPGSGTAATMETCRALGAAVKNGWKPRRTLVYASWDAEEYGLVGSTEWAEANADELKKKAVLMLNVDSAVSGHEVGFSGVPSLRDFVLEAAGAITDVRTGRNLRDIWTEERRKAWAGQSPLVLDDPAWDSNGHDSAAPTQAPGVLPADEPAGVGLRLHRVRRPPGHPGRRRRPEGRLRRVSLDLRRLQLDGEVRRSGVPQPRDGGAALHADRDARRVGRRRADAVRPLRAGAAAHVDELRLIRARKKRQADGQPLAAGREFEGVSDLIQAVQDFQAQAEAFDRAAEAAAHRDGLDPSRLASLNDAISAVERAFLLGEGLPGRPWFKHAVYAPGLTTGYAAWPLPAIRQAIEDNKPAQTAQGRLHDGRADPPGSGRPQGRRGSRPSDGRAKRHESGRQDRRGLAVSPIDRRTRR